MQLSSENKEAGTQTGLSEEEEEACYKEEYNNAVFKLLKNIGMQSGTRSRYSDGSTVQIQKGLTKQTRYKIYVS